MTNKTALINYVNGKSCDDGVKQFIINLIEDDVITSQDLIDRCIYDEDFFKELVFAYLEAKHGPTRCPKCGGKLREYYGGQYRCRKCGAGIGVNGASPPPAHITGEDTAAFMGKMLLITFIVIIAVIIIVAYLIMTYLF